MGSRRPGADGMPSAGTDGEQPAGDFRSKKGGEGGSISCKMLGYEVP